MAFAKNPSATAPDRSSAPPVLVLSSRLNPTRSDALTALATGPAVVARADEPLPEPSGFAGFVIDGPVPELPTTWLRGVRDRVAAGAGLVVIGPAPEGGAPEWAELASPAAGGEVPGEVFAKVIDERHPLVARIAPETAIDDRFVPLARRVGAAVPVAVNVAYRDRDAVQTWTIGSGVVTASGLGQTDSALLHPHLRRMLRRALRTGADGAEPAKASRRDSLGIGIVGYGPYGGMGYYHGTACQSTPGLELVAVCDNSAERRKAAEEQFPGIRTYADPAEMAGDDDLDLAVIATPPTLHAAVAMTFLEAGRHVACEKPLCMTVADADRLAAAADTSDLCLTVNQNRRWDQDFASVRRAAVAGMLGELFNVETFVGGFEHPCRAWHSDTSVSGGTAYDWGSHHVDWILQLLGPASPESVQTFGHKRVWHDVTNLDQIRVRMWWADGREAEFVQSDIAAVRRPKFYLQGTAGTLVGHYRPLVFERVEPPHGYVSTTPHHAEAPADITLSRYESGYGVTETRLPPAPPEPFAFHRNLADHLLLGEPLEVTIESVRRVIEVLEAAQLSADDSGAVVTLG